MANVVHNFPPNIFPHFHAQFKFFPIHLQLIIPSFDPHGLSYFTVYRNDLLSYRFQACLRVGRGYFSCHWIPCWGKYNSFQITDIQISDTIQRELGKTEVKESREVRSVCYPFLKNVSSTFYTL